MYKGTDNRYSLAAVVVVSMLLVFTNFCWFPGNILSWDVFGYYLYLPLVFIYGDLGLDNIEVVKSIITEYNSSSSLYQAYQIETGQWVLRYPIGLAVLYLPFFVLGHFFSLFFGFAADGFSLPYQVAVLLAGIFYSIVGFFLIRRILIRFFNDRIVGFTIMILFLGTNLFWHLGFHGSNAMSHTFLFFFYAAIIHATIRMYEDFKVQRVILVALIAGLAVLSRPSEMVCILIPLFWGVDSLLALRTRIRFLVSNFGKIAIGFLMLLVVVSPQLTYWKFATGDFFFYSYGDNPGEGFDFLSPHIYDVLFSFRKGWLLYTPLMLFSIVGIIIALKLKKQYALAISFYFLFNFLIVSSWSCWWYAESYGQRALLQSYAVLSIPLCLSFSTMSEIRNKNLKFIGYCLIGLLVAFNLFQTWQFKNGLIHPSRMTYESYSLHFMKTKPELSFEESLLLDRDGFNSVNFDFSNYVLVKQNHLELNDDDVIDTLGINGQWVSGNDSYGKAIEIPISMITDKEHAVLRITMSAVIPDTAGFKGSLVCSAYHNNAGFAFRSVDLEKTPIPQGRNFETTMNYLTPLYRSNKDILKIFYWSRSPNGILIKDINVEIWEQNKKITGN